MTTPASWEGPTFPAQAAVQWSEGLPVQLWQTSHTLCSLSRSDGLWEWNISCGDRVLWQSATGETGTLLSKFSNTGACWHT